jgi:hypothetical protein
MSGRRSHPRFAVSTPWDGAMRVLRNVVVDRLDRDELLVISQGAAIVGEEMTLDLMGAGLSLELRVRVLESRPVIVDAAVRHRIRLVVLRSEADLTIQNAVVEPAAVAADVAGAEAI